jgi:hypothetical protein
MVFVDDGDRLRFQTAGRLRRDDVAEVVAVVAHRIDRLLQRRGVMATSEESGGVDRWAEEAPALAGLAAASVQGFLALGSRAGTRIARCGSPLQDVARVTLGPCHANVDGFDLHAGIVVPAGQRERLERLCCYTLRPAIAQTRLRVDAEGQVLITLRHQWSDGTTHLRLDPVALLARLAVLIPRPRINLVLYYGLLAPRAPWRAAVVASAGSEWSDAAAVCQVADERNERYASVEALHEAACARRDRTMERDIETRDFRTEAADGRINALELRAARHHRRRAAEVPAFAPRADRVGCDQLRAAASPSIATPAVRRS